ncbi:hypothetical protein TNCV_2350361 [Trichonephila clavipes]|uniref:Uncharacterized protein n=1 Tax=Trichonephila clavipes TaxID=2585209 RepID=A0A8X6SRM7_TRICX|nr:hypothetical protein TNCV_2350361 [Trichonephila clavipes]
MDELIEMHEQDLEEESLDPVQSEDRMTVGNLTDKLTKLHNTDFTSPATSTKPTFVGDSFLIPRRHLENLVDFTGAKSFFRAAVPNIR